ncbi:MAG: threonylcarbamoyl-AMP synthase [Candidatus Methylarchaceae archaeon HK01M]|nr:threonylcarbamoyl-AMP synthase [Candidatus Methylarchaceae archaeon HK01M]
MKVSRLIVKCNEEGLVKASEIVKKGKLIVYPTDTVYGLGCDPYDSKAIERIFELKSREFKPLPLLCFNMNRAEELVVLDRKGLKLASKFWPGPLTIVAKKKDTALPQILTCGSDKLGVRIPDHSCARRLIELCGGSLVGTSANRSGSRSPRTPGEVLKELKGEFDVIVDGGPTPLGKESTVVDLTGTSPVVIREGAINSSEILEHAEFSKF